MLFKCLHILYSGISLRTHDGMTETSPNFNLSWQQLQSDAHCHGWLESMWFQLRKIHWNSEPSSRHGQFATCGLIYRSNKTLCSYVEWLNLYTSYLLPFYKNHVQQRLSYLGDFFYVSIFAALPYKHHQHTVINLPRIRWNWWLCWNLHVRDENNTPRHKFPPLKG